MKVVINNCFGGFELSNLGELEYLKLKGKDAFFYKQTEYKHNGGVNLYKKISPNEGGMFTHTLTKDMGDSFSEFPDDEFYFSSREIERTDKDLIKVVETLGEKASGQCSSLKVIEIPDDVSWEIDEYDGFESIHEVHRSWS